jgi:hypothetical protein
MKSCVGATRAFRLIKFFLSISLSLIIAFALFYWFGESSGTREIGSNVRDKGLWLQQRRQKLYND